MKWNFLLGITLSAVFSLFILHQIDFDQLVISLQSTQSFLLVAAVLVLMCTLPIRAWRLKYLLKPVKSARTLGLLSATSIGAMADMVLPARAGDIVRAYLIGQKEQISTMTSFATIVVERVWDLLSILLIFAFILIFSSFPLGAVALAEELRIGGYLSSLLCIMLLGSLWLLRSRTVQTIRLMRTYLTFLPEQWLERITGTLQSFALGLQTINRGRHLVSILFLSLFLWTVFALSNFLVLCSFGLHLPLYAAFVLLVFQAFGLMIPSSPGFIGTYHAAVIAGFAVFGVSQELALSVAIIMHAAFFFPFILLGFVFLWTENLSLRELWSVKSKSLQH